MRLTDYENEDTVNETDLVKSSLELEDLEPFDEFVTQEVDGESVVKKEVVSSSQPGPEVSEMTPPLPGKPSGPPCSLCLKDARRPKKLACDGSVVCWNCGVQVDLH